MIKKENFIKAMNLYNESSKSIDKLCKFGIDLGEFTDPMMEIFWVLMQDSFDEGTIEFYIDGWLESAYKDADFICYTGSKSVENNLTNLGVLYDWIINEIESVEGVK